MADVSIESVVENILEKLLNDDLSVAEIAPDLTDLIFLSKRCSADLDMAKNELEEALKEKAHAESLAADLRSSIDHLKNNKLDSEIQLRALHDLVQSARKKTRINKGDLNDISVITASLTSQ